MDSHPCCSLIFLIICTSVIHFTNGQAPPPVKDPFPANPGPEVPKATPPPYQGCPAECNTRLTDAMALIADLEKRVSTLNITVNSRLNNVPTGGSSGTSGELANRVVNVENYLYGNMTMLTNKLNHDLEDAKTTLSQNITDTRIYLDGRIATVESSGPAVGGNAPATVYTNITARLNNLEFDKVQTLIDENNVWRKNFEVVNKTFSKMRKSSYSNDVIVVG